MKELRALILFILSGAWSLRFSPAQNEGAGVEMKSSKREKVSVVCFEVMVSHSLLLFKERV